LETKNHSSTSATMIANACEPPKPVCTAARMSVVAPTLFAAGRESIVPSVAHRYANITTAEPQKRYFLIAFMWTISTPMLSGTSIPSRARMTKPNQVHCPEWMLQFDAFPHPPVAEWPSPISQRIPASPITKIAAP
jgi:hypothetical protein